MSIVSLQYCQDIVTNIVNITLSYIVEHYYKILNSHFALEHRYTNALTMEASCMIDMVQTGVIPACAEDLAGYASSPSLAGNREGVYNGVAAKASELQDALDKLNEDDDAGVQARYCADVIKPIMTELREYCDDAEGLIKAEFYPFPRYKDMLFAHHTEEPRA